MYIFENGIYVKKNGIQFPAVANPSTDPNTLDHYAENLTGAFSLTSGTANLAVTSVSRAFYVKIGRMVYAQTYLQLNNTSGGLISSWRFNGLPFTAASHYGWCDVYYMNAAAIGSKINAYVESDSNYALFSYTSGIPNGATGMMVAFEYPASA